MSYFGAAKVLREQADRLREKDFGVTGAQLDAARQGMRAFSTPVLDALRAEWEAHCLEHMAQILDRYGRESETPFPRPPPSK